MAGAQGVRFSGTVSSKDKTDKFSRDESREFCWALACACVCSFCFEVFL